MIELMDPLKCENRLRAIKDQLRLRSNYAALGTHIYNMSKIQSPNSERHIHFCHGPSVKNRFPDLSLEINNADS
jgi:hypothetical protein